MKKPTSNMFELYIVVFKGTTKEIVSVVIQTPPQIDHNGNKTYN